MVAGKSLVLGFSERFCLFYLGFEEQFVGYGSVKYFLRSETKEGRVRAIVVRIDVFAKIEYLLKFKDLKIQ